MATRHRMTSQLVIQRTNWWSTHQLLVLEGCFYGECIRAHMPRSAALFCAGLLVLAPCGGGSSGSGGGSGASARAVLFTSLGLVTQRDDNPQNVAALLNAKANT